MRCGSFLERFLTGLSSRHFLEFLMPNFEDRSTASVQSFFGMRSTCHFLSVFSFLCQRVTFSDVQFFAHQRFFLTCVLQKRLIFAQGKRLDVQFQRQMHYVVFKLQILVGRRQGEDLRSW